MKNWFLKPLAGCCLLTMTGCAMCCGPFDYSYPTYGGFFQRADRNAGRVGSVFSDPDHVVSGPLADSNLEPIEEGGAMGLPEDVWMEDWEPGDEALPEPGLDPKQRDRTGPVPDDSTTATGEGSILPVNFSNKNWR